MKTSIWGQGALFSAQVFLAALVVVTGVAYSQADRRPEFEVASVKPSDPSNVLTSYVPTLDVRPGATLRISDLRLGEIMMIAYNVTGNQISGPRWLTDPTMDPRQVPRFEIVAKVPANATKDQVPLMLQKLLEDRFKLKFHRESKEMQVYSLEVSRGGHKLTESVASGRPPGCARAVGAGQTYSFAADCYSVTMAQFAQQLPALAPQYFREGPVIDRTGLAGNYDARLEWRRLDEIQQGANGQTIFDAVKKLGLELQKKRENAEMLIVDHCEQVPTEN